MRKNVFFYIILFDPIFSLYIKNPLILKSGKYLFLLSVSNDKYNYIITSEKGLKIQIKTGNITENDLNVNYSSTIIYIEDKLNNSYIYLSDTKKYYKINYEQFILLEEITPSFQSKIPSYNNINHLT